MKGLASIIMHVGSGNGLNVNRGLEGEIWVLYISELYSFKCRNFWVRMMQDRFPFWISAAVGSFDEVRRCVLFLWHRHMIDKLRLNRTTFSKRHLFPRKAAVLAAKPVSFEISRDITWRQRSSGILSHWCHCSQSSWDLSNAGGYL